MKILTAHNRYTEPGGEDTVFTLESRMLKRRGHEVILFEEDNRRLEDVSAHVAAIEAVWSTRSYEKMLTLLGEREPDIAHFHNTFLRISPSAYYACREANVPVVQTIHNYRLICPVATFFRDGGVCEDCMGKTPPWPGVLHGCWRDSRPQTAVVAVMLTVHRWIGTWQERVDLYIALTQFAKSKFVEGGLPPEKIMVKPNFLYSDPGIGENGGDYALYIGRLTIEKGVPTLIRAWQDLDLPLYVAGDGPLRPSLEDGSRTATVNTLGQIPHEKVLARMRSARFLVFPSEWYEGFPMTIVEAFATGLPVIASNLGAMAEIIEDGRTGLLFEPGNSEDLAEKVVWAWSHPNQMTEMGKEARREYEQKYTAERNYEMLMEIYQHAIENVS